MQASPPARWAIRKLDWTNEALGSVALPGGVMTIRSGFGSGLATRPPSSWKISFDRPVFDGVKD